jgi:hypothetical protein
VRLKDFDQTKRIHHRPWCGHDTYALDWGVIKPKAMVGAKAARHLVFTAPSPSEHLGLFWKKKTSSFSPAAANETLHALKLFLKLGK